MQSKTFRSTLLAVAAAGLISPLAAQTPAGDDRFEGKVDVNEVLLDVLVTDKQDNVILGLGKDDFVVQEDGKPVELNGLTFYSSSRFLESQSEAAQKGLSVDRSPQDRYFILFFDDQRDAAFDSPQLLPRQIDAGRKAREWVEKEMLPTDFVAVAGYQKKLKVYQDFTHDRRAVAAAVQAAAQSKDVDNLWPSRIGKPDQGPSLTVALPLGKALRDKTPTIYEGLGELAKAAGGVTGRKNLILFTIGFGRLNNFGLYQPDPRYYTPMVQALNDNNVAVYNVDLTPPGTDHPLSSAMNQLADETGGRYYFNFTNFLTPLRQLAKENSGYYLLSYQSPHAAGTQGFQKVTVKTVNPEFRVRTREGYRYGE